MEKFSLQFSREDCGQDGYDDTSSVRDKTARESHKPSLSSSWEGHNAVLHKRFQAHKGCKGSPSLENEIGVTCKEENYGKVLSERGGRASCTFREDVEPVDPKLHSILEFLPRLESIKQRVR